MSEEGYNTKIEASTRGNGGFGEDNRYPGACTGKRPVLEAGPAFLFLKKYWLPEKRVGRIRRLLRLETSQGLDTVQAIANPFEAR